MMRDEFKCLGCKNAMVTRIACYQPVADPRIRDSNGQPRVQMIREELIQPWCLIGSQPMPLNPLSPIIECEAFEARESAQQEPKLTAKAVTQ